MSHVPLDFYLVWCSFCNFLFVVLFILNCRSFRLLFFSSSLKLYMLIVGRKVENTDKQWKNDLEFYPPEISSAIILGHVFSLTNTFSLGDWLSKSWYSHKMYWLRMIHMWFTNFGAWPQCLSKICSLVLSPALALARERTECQVYHHWQLGTHAWSVIVWYNRLQWNLVYDNVSIQYLKT